MKTKYAAFIFLLFISMFHVSPLEGFSFSTPQIELGLLKNIPLPYCAKEDITRREKMSNGFLHEFKMQFKRAQWVMGQFLKGDMEIMFDFFTLIFGFAVILVTIKALQKWLV